jgi:alpha-tubulin suppressor-like RCC1 family protein
LLDGTVSCWGSNNGGILGGNSTTVPVPIAGLSNIVEIAGGYAHMCAIDYEGVVGCWGDNTWGQLGNDSVSGSSMTPVAVMNVSSAVHLTSGRDHMCALTSSAEMACWGRNQYGQLGLGTVDTNPHLPTSLPFFNVEQVSAAGDYTCALADLDGTMLLCWGMGADGQLGYDPILKCDASYCADAGDGFVAGLPAYPNYVWTGERHACAKTTNGNLYCWGSDVTNALPLSGAIYDTPQLMPTDVYATRSLGSGFSCGINAGSLDCWGRNDERQTGRSTSPYYDTEFGYARFLSPATVGLVPGLPVMDQVSAGEMHACGISVDQNVYCWGYNGNGQVGRTEEETVTIDNEPIPTESLSPDLVEVWLGN